MKTEQVDELKHGIYIVFWKSGGSSLAAVGSTCCQGKWIAPTNWISPGHGGRIWEKVERMELLKYVDEIDVLLGESEQ